jgi:hypothetical protein
LVDGAHHALRHPNILIAIDVLLNGHYYYGGTLSLSNAAGLATFDGEQVATNFEHNQRMFPMDYGTSLTDCDDRLRVLVLGDGEFREARQRALASPFLAPKFREMWKIAQNEPLPSALAVVDLGKADQTRTVDLVLGEQGSQPSTS